MSKGIFGGLCAAGLIALIGLFYFVKPVLVITLKDIFILVAVDVFIAFCLALYLGHDKDQDRVVFWTIIGSICLLIPIVASFIKYKREKNKKNGSR